MTDKEEFPSEAAIMKSVMYTKAFLAALPAFLSKASGKTYFDDPGSEAGSGRKEYEAYLEHCVKDAACVAAIAERILGE